MTTSFHPKHIVVPVDADVTGDRALAEGLVDAAADMASLCDAKLTLVHVALPVATPAVPPIDTFGDAYRAMLDVLEARNAAAGKSLEALKQRVANRGRTCEVRLVTKAGNIPELVVEAATDLGADLLVLTTHGRKGLKRVVLGSIAERTAHLATMPVLLIPPKH